YWVVVARGEPRPLRRRVVLGVIGLLMILTASRSTLLAVMATTVVGLVTRVRPPSLKRVAVTMVAVTMSVAVVLVTPALQHALANVASSSLGDRFSPSEGSAKSHVLLIQRGIQEGSSSIPNGIIGIGYGNAYLVLEDIFPSNKYGNFHSLYVSMFAEVGI